METRATSIRRTLTPTQGQATAVHNWRRRSNSSNPTSAPFRYKLLNHFLLPASSLRRLLFESYAEHVLTRVGVHIWDVYGFSAMGQYRPGEWVDSINDWLMSGING